MKKKLQEEYPNQSRNKQIGFFHGSKMTYALFRRMNQPMVQFVHGIDYTEHFLTKQLVAAIEKGHRFPRSGEKFMRNVDCEFPISFQVFAHSSKTYRYHITVV